MKAAKSPQLQPVKNPNADLLQGPRLTGDEKALWPFSQQEVARKRAATMNELLFTHPPTAFFWAMATNGG